MKRLLHFINGVSLGWLIAAILATILLFAVGYAYLSADGQLVFTYPTEAHPNFLDSVYFSIVTISSLGYGDIRPMGATRVLVGLEVLMGLAFLGLLVAKISSVKQDYILRRMYEGVVDRRLEKFVHELEDQRRLFRTTSQLLMNGEIDPELTTTFRRDSPGSTFFSSYRQLLSDAVGLMTFEASNGALFGEIDDSRIESVYDSVRGVVKRVILMWERDSESACNYVLCDNGDDIDNICTLAERLAQLGLRHSKNRDIVELCEAIVGLTKQVRAEVLPAL